nr:uncharacterized protein LOC109782586 [Aegilops tauschii subsp. strangulata]
MGFFSGTGERLMQIEREEDEEERREKEEDKLLALEIIFFTAHTSRVSQFSFSIYRRIFSLAAISAHHLGTSPFIQPPIPICAVTTTPRAARSCTRRGGSLNLKRCPLLLSPPAADCRFPPSTSSLIGAPSVSVVPASRSRHPHRHKAGSTQVSSFTRSCARVPSVHSPQAALASIRIFSLHHVKRVDLDERVVGGDLPNESHDEAEEYAPLSAMQELHPSSCAGAKECYTGLSLPQEKMIPKKAHIEKFDRVNQGSAESTLPDKQITTQELHPIFLREPKRITLVYLCHTWLLRTHALKSLIRPIKAVQNQPKRVTPIMEVQNQLCRIEQITAQELHPSFSSRTKEDYTGSSLPRMVAKVQSRLYRINFAGKD